MEILPFDMKKFTHFIYMYSYDMPNHFSAMALLSYMVRLRVFMIKCFPRKFGNISFTSKNSF